MRREPRIIIELGLFVLLLFAGAAFAQDSQFRIRAKIDLVVVPVTVKSASDTLAAGLTEKDFAIYEDGRRQTITNFTADPVPLSVAVVVDSGLGAYSLAKVQKTFSALAGAFAKEDEIALYHYGKFVNKDLEFSNNPERIETALNKLRELKPDENPALAANWRGPFANLGPVINGFPVLPPALTGPPYTAPPKPDRVLNDAIFAAAADLGKREHNRRKIILVISDGIDSRSEHSFDDTARILLQMGVQVYAVGLDQPFPYKKLSVLDDFAKATGGDTYFVKSIQHLEKAYATATEQARNQYIIGYVSDNAVQGDGPAFRAITVLADEGKLKTLHKRGYYAFP